MFIYILFIKKNIVYIIFYIEYMKIKLNMISIMNICLNMGIEKMMKGK